MGIDSPQQMLPGYVGVTGEGQTVMINEATCTLADLPAHTTTQSTTTVTVSSEGTKLDHLKTFSAKGGSSVV